MLTVMKKPQKRKPTAKIIIQGIGNMTQEELDRVLFWIRRTATSVQTRDHNYTTGQYSASYYPE